MEIERFRLGILMYGDAMRSALYGIVEFFETVRQASAQQGREVAFECTCYSDEPSRVPSGLRAGGLEETEEVLDVIIVPPQTRKPKVDVCSDASARWLVRQSEKGSVIASACVGAFVLADSGLLNGRRATTHWMLADQFRERYPSVELMDDEIVVDEGDIVTAGGVMAWLDMSLRIVGRFASRELAVKMGKYYLVDTGLREQRFYRSFQPRYGHGDDAILKTQKWLLKYYREETDNVALANVAGLSVRTMQRRFASATGESPSSYVRKLRLQKACEQLEATVKPVDEIVWNVGYEDASAFRKLFKNEIGLTPGEYRKRFAIRV